MTMPDDILKTIVRLSAKRENRKRASNRNRLAFWIGRVVIAFNEVEGRLADCIAKIISQSDKETSDMILASMSYSQKLDLLSALLVKQYHGVPSQLDFCQNLAQSLAKAEEFRNAIVHSQWPAIFGRDLVRRKPKTKGRKGLKVFESIADVDSIREGLREIEDLGALTLGLTNCKLASRIDPKRIGASHEVFDKILNEVAAKTVKRTVDFSIYRTETSET